MPAAPALPAASDTVDAPTGNLNARAVLGHGLRVLIVCMVIGLALGLLHDQKGSLQSVIYSTCIGMCSWAFIDLGRFALKPDPDSGWPPGWRGPALCIVGNVLGFALGSALADLINGFPIYSGYKLGIRRLGVDIAFSALIGALMSGYFYLRGRTRAHQAYAARAERDLSLARLAMLQSQLEPHMLFNTLANLRVLIGLDPARAQAMLDHLIAYLRATLSASRATWHPLSAEFDRLADYLALMTVRMGPRLQVVLDLPDALRAVPVPPMLLQPLVENCIRHGLEPKVAGGRIELRAEQAGSQLRLLVRDTGVGLDERAVIGGPASATATTPTPAALPDPQSGGYGTRHVAERLATLYGQQASLRLQAAGDADGGTLAEVLLPMGNTGPT